MARVRQLILLPPSEGKAAGGSGPPWTPGAMAESDLDDARTELVDVLRTAMDAPEAVRAKLLGVKGVALAHATAANRALLTAPTTPAIRRYTGVLYDYLDAASMTPGHRRRLSGDARIVSGLWGLVRPTDPVPDYKLKMDATITGVGKVSTWWRPRLSPVLDRLADAAIVWDLLPGAHRAAWRADPDAPRARYQVRFTDEVRRNGRTERIAISHWNKALKGALVRFLVAERPRRPEDLARFTHPEGYVVDLDTSTLDDHGGTLELVKRLS